jgi:DNA-binding GntR family transcriptional regulator
MRNDKVFTRFGGLNRATLTEEAAATIRRAILSGEFVNGQQLNESRISEEFQISRAPIREALAQLMTQGLVVHQRNRGYFVRTFTAKDVEDMLLLRAAMEKFAVGLAIERATDDEIDALETIVREMEEGAPEASGDSDAGYRSEYRFHDQICRMAHHDMLRTIWGMMHDQISVALHSVVNAYEWPAAKTFGASHREVLEPIRNRDAAAAKAAVDKHIGEGMTAVRTHPNGIDETAG